MVYLRDFYRFGRLLELDDELRPGRTVPAAEIGCKPDFGFFIDEPSLVFIAPSLRGPVLGVGNALYRLGAGARMVLDGTGEGRVLRVLSGEERVPVEIPAPESGFVDPNFPDEPDMCDFFVWLTRRVPMPHVRASLTMGENGATAQT